MNVREMLASLNSPFVAGAPDSLFYELDIVGYTDLAAIGLMTRDIKTWQCTDTEVGQQAIYLDGQFVAFVTQRYRKSYPQWSWVSKEAFLRVHNKVYAAIMDECDILDLDAEFEEAEVPMYVKPYTVRNHLT